ncbi:fructose-6-phosphate aldolase [Candidatus Micrarchaeota archaeon]|nr:fructose-6-phosphate aldolase [Candidatus Micrarchaeota archaeon]
MKIFLDTAVIDEIKKGLETGLIDGVTTNPTLVSQAKVDFKAAIAQIASLANAPAEWAVSAEVTALDCAGMINEGIELAAIAPSVVIKVPLTVEGLKACKALSGKKIKTNATLVFSPNQAILAAKAGATYVSPFVGRLDDVGQNGMQLISDIKAIYDNYGYSTKIIVASIRSPQHVVQSGLAGAHVVTIPPKIFSQMFSHPLTDIGVKKFMEDWAAFKK